MDLKKIAAACIELDPCAVLVLNDGVTVMTKPLESHPLEFFTDFDVIDGLSAVGVVSGGWATNLATNEKVRITVSIMVGNNGDVASLVVGLDGVSTEAPAEGELLDAMHAVFSRTAA